MKCKSFQTGWCVLIPAFTFPALSVSPSSDRSDIFLIHSLIKIFFLICLVTSLLHIKPLVPINKQFSVDSFLDWLVVMGPGQKFLTRVGSGQFFVALVGSGQPFMVWVRIWKISPKNVKFFNFFPSGQKNCFGSGRKVPGSKPGRPLIYCGSKVSSGRVGSGQGPSLLVRSSLGFLIITLTCHCSHVSTFTSTPPDALYLLLLLTNKMLFSFS